MGLKKEVFQCEVTEIRKRFLDPTAPPHPLLILLMQPYFSTDIHMRTKRGKYTSNNAPGIAIQQK